MKKYISSLTIRRKCFLWVEEIKYNQISKTLISMYLRLISDLHYEHYETEDEREAFWRVFSGWVGKVKPNTYLLLAGDLCQAFKHGRPNPDYEELLSRIRKQFLFQGVIFVAGNHEFYDSYHQRSAVIERLKEVAEKTKCTFLHRSSVVIDGVLTVSGTTLWSNITPTAAKYINDFSPSNAFDNSAEAVGEHLQAVQWLNQLKVKTPHEVILTHHLPTCHLVHSKYRESKLNSAYASEILSRLNLDKVDYIFSGHTHEQVSYRIPDTNTLCITNPLGYPNERRETHLIRAEFEIK